MADDGRKSNGTTVAGYDRLVQQRSDLETSPWAGSAYQRYYVWPAVRSILPTVSGTTVLDAGCGIGDYSEWFLDHGSEVVGVDASSEAIATAERRLGSRATFYCADLTEQLEFASENQFDLVFANLVLGHIENWRPVLAEFGRVLTADGSLVFTVIHPVRRYRRHRDELASYYDVDSYVLEWGDTGAAVEQYHRPIAEIIDSLVETEFCIDQFREITPREEYRDANPERYEKATEEPDTLCVRAEPRPEPRC
ncbi:class I SAM-dependent methyltransferase [Natronobacterium texcoconense]|uniref:Methyltransferase domain-containing protein n=1 Tax=Natronobacterium texcoconense TaxID=1095778 RepID=A0A1H1BZT2_NATTX|nr:class I SAM-dependent methyltransferase [Natronobacterium texcoconense]SDQ57435.1 Methyltransferase domain-containing protein [Natronobacterium texcoconense]